MNNNCKKNIGIFYARDLFDILPISKKLSNKDLSDNGKIEVHSSETVNNGIIGYTNKRPDFVISNKKPVYIIFGDHTKNISIVRNDFCVFDNVKVLVPHINNDLILMYIISIWKKAIPDLGYSRHWNVAKNVKIFLPIDDSGNLNYKFMETYMKSIENKVNSRIVLYNKINSGHNYIDTKKWNSFTLGEIFDVRRPRGKSKSKYKDGNIPYVSSGNYNNGIIGYVEKHKNEIIEKGNCITVSPVDGSTFYQKESFVGRGGAGSSILLLYNNSINEYSGYYLVTLIRKACNKFVFSDMANKTSIKNITIKLPVLKNKLPDYKKMERYTRNLIKNSGKKIGNLLIFY